MVLGVALGLLAGDQRLTSVGDKTRDVLLRRQECTHGREHDPTLFELALQVVAREVGLVLQQQSEHKSPNSSAHKTMAIPRCFTTSPPDRRYERSAGCVPPAPNVNSPSRPAAVCGPIYVLSTKACLQAAIRQSSAGTTAPLATWRCLPWVCSPRARQPEPIIAAATSGLRDT